MPNRRLVRPGLVLAAIATISTACGGTTPASGGTASVAASVGSLPSFGLPSFRGDAELASLIPTEIAGTPIQTTTISGDEFGALAEDDDDRAELDAFLGALNRSLSDVSVAFASASIGEEATSLSINAFRVRGAETGALLAGISQLVVADLTSPVIEQATLGGKPVTVISEPGDDAADKTYLYGKGDVVFQVETDDLAILEETFSKLP